MLIYGDYLFIYIVYLFNSRCWSSVLVGEPVRLPGLGTLMAPKNILFLFCFPFFFFKKLAFILFALQTMHAKGNIIKTDF